MRSIPMVLFLILCPTLSAQELLQDWTQSTKTFDQQDPGTLRITITGVNTFLYAYATEWSAQDQSLSDFNNIIAYLPKNAVTKSMAATQAQTCDSMVNDVKAAIQENLAPKSKASVPLADSQKAWNQYVSGKYKALLDDQNCKNADGVQPLKDGYNRLFPSSGISSAVAVVDHSQACKTYVVIIHEFYQGTATDKTITATVPITCEQLTFSAGTLLTGIPNPTYNSRPSPTQPGQFLSIEQTGHFRPTIVGLLNYNFPALTCGNWCDPFRIGLSAGPVFQNSQNNASSFGVFLGGSISVYKRLYLSAGEHWGEFAAPPFGLTNGSPIPPNFGQLTPRLRYTARFGLGITFRTNDVSKAFSGGTTTANTTATPR